MTTPAIPYDSICDTEDRSFTTRLLSRLVDPSISDDERGDITWTLERLADPRATEPLIQILEGHHAEAIREAAGCVMRGIANTHTPAQLLRWWQHGDRVLQRHALLSMGHEHAAIVAEVAGDPGHVLHREGIYALQFGFEEPAFQRLKIAALDHSDLRVREAAADVLMWDEPVAAEEPLLRVARDPIAAVAVAAINTLQYYKSNQCIRVVADLRKHSNELVAKEADDIWMTLRSEAVWMLTCGKFAVEDRVRDWLRPVWELLALTEEELSPPPDSPMGPPRAMPPPTAMTIPAIEALLADPDGKWTERKTAIRNVEWAAFGSEERTPLTRLLVRHVDPYVRGEAARVLSLWSDVKGLIDLTFDSSFGVRKTAMYWLGQLPPDATAAARAWEHLHHPGTTSTHAYETLETYVAHAPEEASIPRLVELAKHDMRETVRYHAIYALTKMRAKQAIEDLVRLLEQPPQVTWSIHLALLEACSKLSVTPPGLDMLREVDNLDVQKAVADWDE